MGLVPVIAIDGTAGSGKGTVAALLAARLGFYLLESGRIYRAAGLMALRQLPADNTQLADNAQLQNIAANAARQLTDEVRRIDNGDNKDLAQVFGELFAGADLDGEQVGQAASAVASVGAAREALLPLQRAARKAPGLVAEGRDMATVIFADAAVKLYLDADIEVRAARRVQQLQNRGVNATISNVRASLVARDNKDKSRAIAPLRPAANAVIKDSAKCSAAQIAEDAAHLFFVAAQTTGAE